MSSSRFKPGQSGNPRGRPKGVKSAGTLFRNMLEEHAEEVIEKVLDLAKRGSSKHQKLVLERILPPLKSSDAQIKMHLKGTATLKADTIIDAVSKGKISPTEGEKLMNLLLSQTKVIEHDELMNRVRLLENMFNISKGTNYE